MLANYSKGKGRQQARLLPSIRGGYPKKQVMKEPVQNGCAFASAVRAPSPASETVLWLQTITLVWMLAECGLSLYAAVSARSTAMLAFGSDSLVELMSASVVLLQFSPRLRVTEKFAARTGGALLYVLAAIVGVIAIAELLLHIRAEVSGLGIAVTIAALIVMPVLAALKRKEARRSGNAALAADAVQSAMCAYLAMIALSGLALNAIFRIAWLDSAAALAAIPILLKEGRDAWKGKGCACC